ncbi:MAG: START-like domain-containing protein [Flavobacteriales bacterium]
MPKNPMAKKPIKKIDRTRKATSDKALKAKGREKAKADKGSSAARTKAVAKKSPAGKKPVTGKKAPSKASLGKKVVAKGKAVTKGSAVKKAVLKKSIPNTKAAVKATAKKQPTAKKTVQKAVPKALAVKKSAPAKTSTKPVAPNKTAANQSAPAAKKIESPAQPKTQASPSAVRPALKKAKKDRYLLEFYLNATPASLFDLISTPSGFSEWFCDDVDVHETRYVFKWGAEQETAICLANKYHELMRFRWEEEEEEDPNSYFELRIRVDGMTNETCLVVTAHAWPQDVEESKALWQSQIQTLARVLGA